MLCYITERHLTASYYMNFLERTAAAVTRMFILQQRQMWLQDDRAPLYFSKVVTIFGQRL
jgi:hypothetical protein